MMEPLFTLKPALSPPPKPHSARKTHGVHYTPPELAGFVARRALARFSHSRELIVLDPACGDGELLLAVSIQAEAAGFAPPRLVGIDRNEEAASCAEERLRNAYAAEFVTSRGDFLSLGSDRDGDLPAAYDLVVSNPPYVRTQVLGAARAQELGRQFGLTGRVDLYHAFVAAMTAKLGVGGILGLLCSNRFLTTKGGQSLRSLLLHHFEIEELWDLGDTKLFEAAVLPAVVVARRAGDPAVEPASFVRVYEDANSTPVVPSPASLLETLEDDIEGTVQILDRRFMIERGQLVDPAPEQPWRLTSADGSRWLHVVKQHSAGRLSDLGPIRVGIKTTADSVFIRSTWDDLPPAMRPEDELLRPLLTHRVAARWRATEDPGEARMVLYPHEVTNGRRQAVDLAHFPRAGAYLEDHRDRLEGREYVRKSGRAWYEIWVPQQPDAWAAPKLVWPDISDLPRFFLDRSGAIVNGDCYWLSCPRLSDEEMALALAVANSSFAVEYYDLCFGNRLYAGRRRFITQYLEDLPMPAASSAAMRDIATMVEQLRSQPPEADTDAIHRAESELNAAVAELFGLKEVAGQT